MSTAKRLSEVLHAAIEISFDDTSKFVFFSDCHRGDNSWADDFAHNQQLLFHALKVYNKEAFTYIEVGDGDELWENKDFSEIRKAHSHIFWQMQQFYEDGRLYLIWGNHDIEKRNPKQAEKKLHRFYNYRRKEEEPLFDGIEVHEGIVLRYTPTGHKILVAHGHQADGINDRFWWLGRFFVRNLWRHLQLIGIHDPTSPAKNFEKRGKVERRIMDWVGANNQMIICGHTHRSMFPEPEGSPYFNTGSCVHPRCITGIEIQDGAIALIKWAVETDEDGTLAVRKSFIEGPDKLQVFFGTNPR